eukprot:m.251171 g.251171  ORF g.251171 m.251171 type:complete len:152 (-) comp19535_c0_seq1:1738-2193(-)
MAKSLRSKVKRKFRTIKRQKYHSRVVDALKTNATEDDRACKKPYARAFIERALATGHAILKEREERKASMEDVESKEGTDVLSKEQLSQIKAVRSGAAEGESLSETLKTAELSKTQLNKLVKASRVKRYSMKKKNRRNIQTKNSKRRTDKR